MKDWLRVSNPLTTWETRALPGESVWFHPLSTTGIVGALTSDPSDYGQWVANHDRFKPVTSILVAKSVASTKALNKVAQKKWDLGVTVLEFKQTAGMVADLADSMVGAVDACINVRKKARRQINDLFRRVRVHDDFYRAAAEVGMRDLSLLEDIRSRWMQYQFGIKPAVADIANAGTALDEAIFGHNNGLLVVAKAGHRVTDRTTQMLSTTGAPFTTRIFSNLIVQAHASVSYRVPTDGVSRINLLGLDNPAYLFWEVTRLSWMFDYVVGVGDWLQSFTAANGLEFIEGSLSTTWQSLTTEVQHELSVPGLEFVKRPSTRGLYIDAGGFNRDLLSHGLFPGVVPQIKSEMGLVQLANSIFALSTLLTGGPALR